MSEHYDTTQKCPKCGIHHNTDDHFCDGLAALNCSACGYELDRYINHMECYKCGKWYEKTPQNTTDKGA